MEKFLRQIVLYSGESPLAMESELRAGLPAAEREGAPALASPPDDVFGADYVQAATAEPKYSAVDLMEAAVGHGSTHVDGA